MELLYRITSYNVCYTKLLRFRNIINDQDLTNIGESRQRELIQELNKESIGLTNNDVLLYYNLLKINQLSQNRIDQRNNFV